MKIDFLYPYHFNGKGSGQAFKRLSTSIKSVINQDVNICVVNTGNKCIWKQLSKISNNIKYIHKESTKDFNKPRTINFGVKQLVSTNYFILSDIDLVYQKSYVQSYEKYFYAPIPKRVVPFNYNLNTDFYYSDFDKYIPYMGHKDPDRQHYGIAPGNGLIHTKSFYTIRGYNEDLFGYAPEDADFNLRIQYVNNYIEDSNPNLRTIHLYHKFTQNTMSKYYSIQYESLKKYLEHLCNKFDFYNTIDRDYYIQCVTALQANKNREWGILD